MNITDTTLTAAAGATIGLATAIDTGGQLFLSLMSAAVGAGMAYGILKKAGEMQEKELNELRAALHVVEKKLDDVRDRLSRIEGVCVVRHNVHLQHHK